jgi:hypothetical protein
MPKKPQSESTYLCPLFKQKQEDVCHTCGFYTYLRGTNPNDGKEIDHWACAIEFLPVLLIENSQQSRQTGAAVESFRNEMVRANELHLHTMVKLAEEDRKIEMKDVNNAIHYYKS